MKHAFLGFFGAAFLTNTILAGTTTINFDAPANGTVIDMYYSGVTFTNPIGGDIYARDGGGFAPSSPNVVSVFSTTASAYPFFDAQNGAVDAKFAVALHGVSVDVRPVSPLEYLGSLTSRPYLQAFDAAGNLLGTVYYAGPLPTNCCFSVGAIEKLRFVSPTANIARARLSSQQPNPYHTYALFDNLRSEDGYYSLTVNVVGNGTVAVNPTPGPYSYNTTVTATATPAYGWTFSGWSGAASGTSTSVGITMDADKTVTATFVLASQSGPNFVVTTNDDHDDGIAGVLDCTLREAI